MPKNTIRVLFNADPYHKVHLFNYLAWRKWGSSKSSNLLRFNNANSSVINGQHQHHQVVSVTQSYQKCLQSNLLQQCSL